MIGRLRQRQEWAFFSVLPRADKPLAVAWWAVLVLRGVLPAVFAIAMGLLVGAVQSGDELTGPLALVGVVFVGMQVVTPLHQAISGNLGSRLAAWLHDRLTEACVRPEGIGHLEDPELAGDLTVAREFDLGMTGPPMHLNMDFIAGSLVELVAGLASAVVLFGYAWWAPIVLAGGWLSTHWLLRESAVWKDRNTDEVRAAQRNADYAFRMAVDPPAAKEVRLFGLVGWTVDRFVANRRRLFEIQHRATRLREKPVIWSLLVVTAANVAVFWSLADAAASGRLDLDRVVVFAQVAVGTGMIAFGGLNWALDGAAAPVAAVLRLEPAMGPAGALDSARPPSLSAAEQPRTSIDTRAEATGADGDTTRASGTTSRPGGNGVTGPENAGLSESPGVRASRRERPSAVETAALALAGAGLQGATGMPAREISFRDVTFTYPRMDEPVLEGLDLTIPAGSSLAIVGQNGAGKTTLAKLLCRLYDPQGGAIEVDGVDLRHIDVAGWRSQLTAVFQDFVRFELPLRDNVAPHGAPDDVVRAALEEAGATGLADLDTPLAKGYPGGTDLSGGQWQRVALARALCTLRQGAQVVLLDEPTAQLDVRGEAEIFERILTATREATTILVSHRFSTVRQADRICVLEHGRVVELGSHDELMAEDGRYRTMFDLQAERFQTGEDEEGLTYDVLN
jgi:ATP-binding cassette, subfamily B, bacterial